jgi:hypothetical protein
LHATGGNNAHNSFPALGFFLMSEFPKFPKKIIAKIQKFGMDLI